MISLQKIRQLEPRLAERSDSELEELRDGLYDVAQLAFEVWWTEKHGSKNPIGLLPQENEEDTT